MKLHQQWSTEKNTIVEQTFEIRLPIAMRILEATSECDRSKGFLLNKVSKRAAHTALLDIVRTTLKQFLSIDLIYKFKIFNKIFKYLQNERLYYERFHITRFKLLIYWTMRIKKILMAYSEYIIYIYIYIITSYETKIIKDWPRIDQGLTVFIPILIVGFSVI